MPCVRNIVHRDLKPENLLLATKTDDADIKIADFGFAIEAAGETLTQVCQFSSRRYTTLGRSITRRRRCACAQRCGTPGYVAPEIIEGKKYGKTVDMWALGTYIHAPLPRTALAPACG